MHLLSSSFIFFRMSSSRLTFRSIQVVIASVSRFKWIGIDLNDRKCSEGLGAQSLLAKPFNKVSASPG
jgi:hypothetical protein